MTEERAAVIAELQRHGARLREARDIERDELDAIADLLLRALRAGVRKQDIARHAGVSRPWIDSALTQRADDEPDA